MKNQKEFAKDGTLIDAAVKAIAKSSKCDEQEAAESLLSGICSRYEDAFLKVSLNNDVLSGLLRKKMNAVSVESMLFDCGINATNARTLFRHLNHFFGKSFFESEHKHRAYFGNNDFPPTVKKMELEDKTWVYFWYKQPDLLLQHQIKEIISATDLEGIIGVDIACGGDHGGGRFRMLLKILLRFTNKPSISHNYEVANVSHSQDDIDILKKTVLDAVIGGLRVIANGGRFVIGQDFRLSFTPLNADEPALCDVPIRLFINGDLKFFAQILGRDGMSTSWCMWCRVHPSEWKGLDGVDPQELWSIDSQKKNTSIE